MHLRVVFFVFVFFFFFLNRKIKEVNCIDLVNCILLTRWWKKPEKHFSEFKRVRGDRHQHINRTKKYRKNLKKDKNSYIQIYNYKCVKNTVEAVIHYPLRT